jgi:hypothetical protein
VNAEIAAPEAEAGSPSLVGPSGPPCRRTRAWRETLSLTLWERPLWGEVLGRGAVERVTVRFAHWNASACALAHCSNERGRRPVTRSTVSRTSDSSSFPSAKKLKKAFTYSAGIDASIFSLASRSD